MKLNQSEQEAIVALLTRIYMDISAIETEFELLAGEGDFRPRIEYFHDAIRAFSSQNPKHRERDGRLSIENLSYDLSCLRFLQSQPLASFKPHAQNLSPHTELVVLDQNLTIKSKRPDRPTRERLSDLYKHYAVLFAALLKPAADRDYHERTDSLNHDVADLNSLIHEFEAMNKGKGSVEGLATAIQNLEDESLRHALLAFMQKLKFQKADDRKKAAQKLKEQIKKKDKEIAGVEKAHMDYALSQLGIYEESKDMLKKMAGQGMNLVGKFVENAMKEARREMGR